jgi:hypothetical protein
MYRKATSTLPVKGIPLVSQADVTKHFMMFTQNDTSLRIKIISTTAGVPNGGSV